MSALFPGGASVALSLSFDDARTSQLDGLAILDDHGVRGTLYVLPSAVAAALDRWRRAAESGHEIGNHSHSHPCSGNFPFSRRNALEELTLDEIAADIDTANRLLGDLLGTSPATFAYPCGQSFVGRGNQRRSYVPLVAERFIAGRGYGGETANRVGVCDLAHLDAYAIDGLDAATLWSLLPTANSDHGEWVIMAGHDIGSGGPQTVIAAELDRFCRRVAGDARIWVAPVGDVARAVRWRGDRTDLRAI